MILFKKTALTVLTVSIMGLYGCEYTKVQSGNPAGSPDLSTAVTDDAAVKNLEDQIQNLQNILATQDQNNAAAIQELVDQISELTAQLDDLQDGDGGNNGGGQTATLQVTSTTPAEGVTLSALSSVSLLGIDLKVVFDQELATPDASLFSVVKTGDAQPLAGVLTVEAGTSGKLDTLKFNPTANLSASSSFTMTVKGGASGVKSLDGTKFLSADKIVHFQTGAVISTTTPIPDGGVPGTGGIDIPTNTGGAQLPPINTNPIQPVVDTCQLTNSCPPAAAVVAAVGTVTSPKDGETSVDRNTSITISFSSRIDLTSVMKAVSLVELEHTTFDLDAGFKEGPVVLLGSPTTADRGLTYVIQPSSALKGFQNYRVKLLEVKNTKGEVVITADTNASTFRTEVVK